MNRRGLGGYDSTIKSVPMFTGPEKPTVIERFTQLLPLRYPLAALVWTIIIGPLGIRLIEFSESAPVQPLQPVAEFLGGLSLFYLFWVVRHLRLKVVAAEPQVSLLIPEGERGYHSFFGSLNRTGPILLLALFLQAVAFTLPVNYPSLSATGIFSVVSRFIILLTFACFIWEFCSTEWGLHEIGESSVRLRSFMEDRFMGTKSLGNLALSLTLAYLAGVLLLFLNFANQFGIIELWLEGFFFILLGIGVVMFFLPLNSVHKKMQAEILRNQKELGQEYLKIKKQNAGRSLDRSASLDGIESGIIELVQWQNLQYTERKYAGALAWPFDIQLLAKLMTVVLSVATILIAQVITGLLGV